MIQHMSISSESNTKAKIYHPLYADLKTLAECRFIQWCRQYPNKVTEPQWFSLITNLVPLRGGHELIHEISSLDTIRYTQKETDALIERIITKTYHPVSCRKLASWANFHCPLLLDCFAQYPMHMAAISDGSMPIIKTESNFSPPTFTEQ